MNWLTRYRLRHFFQSSFWIAPSCALFVAVIMARVLRFADEHLHWVCLDFTEEGAKAILETSISSMLTFIVVVVSSLLLVVQLVSASLTPRIIAPTFRNWMIRAALSAFVFAYIISVCVLGRLSVNVPQLAVAAAVSCNAVSILTFLYFVGAIGMGMRPAKILLSTAANGRKVILDIYPLPFDASRPQDSAADPASDPPAVSDVIQYSGTSGVLLAFDTAGLVAIAHEHQAVIELVPRVGDYIADGEPLFRVCGANTIDPRRLRRMVAMGPERTLEQDPRLAFRIIVDIACKALSPAINDPTTGVLAIDQLHRLLRWVGTRELLSGTQRDSSGTVRLKFSTPTWEDFVWLATAEIRQYGGDSIRICQRLRAMLMHLILILPESRRPELEQHLAMLNQTVDRRFSDPADRSRIRAGNSQLNGAATDA